MPVYYFFFVHLRQNLYTKIYEKINWAFMLLVLTTTLFACSNDEQVLEQETTNTTSAGQKKLNGKIPFTVENVQNALPHVLKHYE